MPTVADEDADDSSWWQHANTLKRAMATIPTESLKLGHQSAILAAVKSVIKPLPRGFTRWFRSAGPRWRARCLEDLEQYTVEGSCRPRSKASRKLHVLPLTQDQADLLFDVGVLRDPFGGLAARVFPAGMVQSSSSSSPGHSATQGATSAATTVEERKFGGVSVADIVAPERWWQIVHRGGEEMIQMRRAPPTSTSSEKGRKEVDAHIAKRFRSSCSSSATAVAVAGGNDADDDVHKEGGGGRKESPAAAAAAAAAATAAAARPALATASPLPAECVRGPTTNGAAAGQGDPVSMVPKAFRAAARRVMKSCDKAEQREGKQGMSERRLIWNLSLGTTEHADRDLKDLLVHSLQRNHFLAGRKPTKLSLLVSVPTTKKQGLKERVPQRWHHDFHRRHRQGGDAHGALMSLGNSTGECGKLHINPGGGCGNVTLCVAAVMQPCGA